MRSPSNKWRPTRHYGSPFGTLPNPILGQFVSDVKLSGRTMAARPPHVHHLGVMKINFDRRVPGPRRRVAALTFWLCGATSSLGAQELVPAAYTPAPSGVNLLSFSVSYSSGALSFEPSAPIEDGSARISATVPSYARTFGLLGRSANVLVALPYIVGDLEGRYLGEQAQVSRAGLGDATVRVGMNVLGAPVMSRREFADFDPGTMIGVSLTTRVPVGQYDAEKLINIGTNRWAFKPEVGIVQILGRFAIDAYVGAWFFTTNTDLIGGLTQDRRPIFSTEAHFRYNASSTVWASLDANFWRGGVTTVNGVVSDDRQRESRVGATVVVRVARGQTVRLVGSIGAVTRIGGDFDSIGLSYAFNWF